MMPQPNDDSDNTLPSAQTQQSQSDIIDGKYRIISTLGQGGMGTVYLAEQIFLKAQVALKVLNESHNLNETNRRRFQTEGKASFALNHPNLVKVLDFGILENSAPYFSMEYVPGISLQQLLKEQKNLGVKQILQIFDQVCSGLSYAHQRHVIHRDIKPSNIMIASSGGSHFDENMQVKLVDFGIAKILNEDRGEVQALTQTGEIFGSPLYMSPEQCQGGMIDERTDIYSLGCTLFEALTGTPPHVGPNALRTMMLHTSEKPPSLKEASLGKHFAPALEAVVAKMLEREVADRYQNVEQVRDDLRAVSGSGGNINVAANAQRRAPDIVMEESKERGRAGIIISVLLGLLLSGAIVFGALKIFNDKPKATAVKNSLAPADAAMNEAFSVQSAELKALRNASPIIASVVDAHGEKALQIKFPDSAIGLISYGEGETPFTEAKNAQDAKGTVEMPLNVPLCLFIGDFAINAFTVPEVISKVPENLISKLIFDKPKSYGFAEEAPKSQTEIAEKLAKVLKNAEGWKSLKAISLSRVRLTADSVTALNNMKTLASLAVWNNFGTEQALFETPLLMRLEALHLRKVDSDAVLEKISRSRKIKKISLDDVTATPRTFVALSHCQNLESLYLITRQLTDDNLAALAKIKSLKEIFFDDVSMTADQLQRFCDRTPQIKTVCVSNATAGAAGGLKKSVMKIKLMRTPARYSVIPEAKRDPVADRL